MGLFVFLLFFKTRARRRVQGSDKFSTSKTHTVFLRTESTPQCSKWSITTSLMKVSVSVIHYGTEFESEWKPASDAVQCFELPPRAVLQNVQKKQRNDADEWKAEYQYFFFSYVRALWGICHCRKLMLSACLAASVLVYFFIFLTHVFPSHLITSVSFIFLREGTPNTFNSLCLWFPKHEA